MSSESITPGKRSSRSGFSRLAYTESLDDEKGPTAATFLTQAKIWFASHGIDPIHRVVVDNGVCYRSGDFARIVGNTARHQRTKPDTPRHHGKLERYQRILAEELLYAREYQRERPVGRDCGLEHPTTTTGRTVGAAGQPPASRLRDSVTNAPHR